MFDPVGVVESINEYAINIGPAGVIKQSEIFFLSVFYFYRNVNPINLVEKSILIGNITKMKEINPNQTLLYS